MQARDRRKGDPSVPKTLAPAIISTVTLSGSNAAQVEFATRVQANGIPGFTTGGGESVVSVDTVNATTLLLTFSGDVAGATMSVPEGDRGIRTPAGGFVPAGNYMIPAA
jgi:hypothetical protein